MDDTDPGIDGHNTQRATFQWKKNASLETVQKVVLCMTANCAKVDILVGDI